VIAEFFSIVSENWPRPTTDPNSALWLLLLGSENLNSLEDAPKVLFVPTLESFTEPVRAGRTGASTTAKSRETAFDVYVSGRDYTEAEVGLERLFMALENSINGVYRCDVGSWTDTNGESWTDRARTVRVTLFLVTPIGKTPYTTTTILAADVKAKTPRWP